MFLFFTNPYLLVALLTLWYVTFASHRYINLIFIFIFINGALNSWLKFIFKVPLHESLNNECWYSFPSGHMQYALVFWGILWINTGYNLKFLVIVILLLVASGYSMNARNYHTPLEMIGAIPPAIAILTIYNITLKRINLTTNNLLWLNIISILIQLITLNCIKSPCSYYTFNWMWLNVGANLGFGIMSLITEDQSVNIKQKLKLVLSSQLFYLVFLLTIVELVSINTITNIYKTATINGMCGVLLPIVLYFTSKLYKKLNTNNE